MALTDFFRINLPYGIKCNSDGKWMAFNREYMPLGWNSMSHKISIMQDDAYSEIPIYTYYEKLTDKVLEKLAWSEKGIIRNDKGKIIQVFFYNDLTNPTNNEKEWPRYFRVIKTLSRLKTN